MRVGITNAISIANDERIKNTLQTGQRALAISSLKDISNVMQEYTEFKNIKIHLHTKDNKSFLRNWKLDKFGDDLSSFCSSVVDVNKNLKPITTFEPGRAGLQLRAIVSIFAKDGEHVGSLEFIQGMDSVVKAFDKTHQGFFLLIDKHVSDTIKTGKNFLFNDDVKFKNYIISQKYSNKDCLEDAKSLHMPELFTNGFVLSSKYYYTYTGIYDFQNKKLGIILLAKPLSAVNTVIEKSQMLINIALGGIFLMTIIITLVIISAVKNLF